MYKYVHAYKSMSELYWKIFIQLLSLNLVLLKVLIVFLKLAILSPGLK